MAIELRIELADEWWVAWWMGSEAKGSTALEAAERLAARLSSVRHGTTMPTVGENVEFIRASWPMVEGFVNRMLSRPQKRSVAPTGGLKEVISEAEAAVLVRELETARGNVSKAARALGMSRFGLMKKMARLGVERPRV